MICRELKVTEAIGMYLFNQMVIGGVFFPKAHKLTEDDIVLFKQNKIDKIFVADLESGDISFEVALGEVAAKLCGKNTAYSVGEDGICRIAAGISGVLMVNEDRVSKFNRHGSDFILNTIQPYKLVEADTIIAELELNLPLISQDKVDELLFSLSGNTDMLSVHDISAKKVGLMYTRLTNDKSETRHFTNIVKRLVKDFPNMDLTFEHEYEAPHQVEEIANMLQRALKDDNDVLFILPAQQTRCRQDIIFQALNSIVDEIVCAHLPQISAGDFIIAAKKEKRIIVIPYNYNNIESSYPVRYIKQAIVADKLNVFDFDHPQNCIMQRETKLPEEMMTNYITSAGHDEKGPSARVAAIVLAAGVGARCGRNKLLVDINGEPLFLKALQAAVKSEASPVFLVTGYQAEMLDEYLDKIDVNVLYNSGFRSGVRTSISLGIKSVPSFCDGAILIPADMPNITVDHINNMIKNFEKGKDKQVVISMFEGKKVNPIIWSKELFEFADVVPENADLRPVFVEFADYTKIVEIKDKKETLDITYPLDLEDYAKSLMRKK